MNSWRPFVATMVFSAAVLCSGCPKQSVSAKPPQPADATNQQSTPAPVPSANTNDQKPPAPAPRFPSRPAGPLGDLGQDFVGIYTSRRASVLAHRPPYVTVLGSSLELSVPGKQPISVPVLLEPYHALKDVAHTPFAAYLLLLPVAYQEVTLDSQAKSIDELSARIASAQKEVTDKWFATEALERQKTILDTTEDLLHRSMTAGKVSREELDSFAHKLGPLMLKNAWDGGCLQVKETHRQMMRWKDDLSTQDWNTLIVLNRGTHQARYRNAATQYFHWLFNDDVKSWAYPGESFRVVFVESLGKGETTNDEFATILIDANASEAFFGDPWRLSEDVLSDGAAACIKELPEAARVKN